MTCSISTLNYIQRLARELDHLAWKIEQDLEQGEDIEGVQMVYDIKTYLSDKRKVDHVKNMTKELMSLAGQVEKEIFYDATRP